MRKPSCVEHIHITQPNLDFMLIFYFRCETQTLESGIQIIAPNLQKFIRIFGSEIRHGSKG